MKYFLRLLLSPIAMVWAILLLGAGTLFPLPISVMYSFTCLVGNTLIFLMRLAEIDIDYLKEPFVVYFDDFNLNHIAGLTIYLWLPILVVWEFIFEGVLLFSTDFL